MCGDTFAHPLRPVKYSPGIINPGGNSLENSVKIFCKQGKSQYLVSETNVELFLSRMKVSWVQDRCFITFATPEGGVELELPRSSTIDMIESLIMMLPHEDIQELLAGMSEVMA